jgi:hypothetical protein
MAETNATVPGGRYRSPVATRVLDIRHAILANADANRWQIQQSAARHPAVPTLRCP